MNIYKKLDKPIFSLAPMEGITDCIFRKIVTMSSRPDLTYTEFINVDGFNSKGRKDVSKRLRVLESDIPIVVQLWGLKPENFKKTAKVIRKKYPIFKGIDINMGCSVRNVLSRGTGAGLIETPTLAKEIIEAIREGSGGLPVSVKTRIGYEGIKTEEWLGFLLEQDLDVITVHGRIAKQGYSENANWEEIGKVVKLRNEMEKSTLIFGNGDVKSLKEAKEKVDTYGVDGVMIGRDAWSNPWVFSGKDIEDISFEEKKKMLEEHIKLYMKEYGNTGKIYELRKFFKIYINGFEGASKIRQEMMEIEDGEELLEYVKDLNF